ncbi:hypothetical protein UlMin_031863 [Ulmus minor]
MGFSVFLYLFVFVLLDGWGVLVVAIRENTSDISFDQNYNVKWGFDHVLLLNQGKNVQLSMDKSSGAGFASKLSYGSGSFNMRIKLAGRNSAGVVTAYYPITLQTNVFVNGQGGREQRIKLWFDPVADFHNYKILWNPYQIVFFVDDTPIRVFKNNTKIGVDYPTKPMQIEASLWDGSAWATDGGKTKIDWSYAPFKVNFQEFTVNGCSSVGIDCYSNEYFWNAEKFLVLDLEQQKALQNVRKNYMNYDYCFDRNNHPTIPPECLQTI